MAVREAVKIIADAMEANAQTKLNAMSVVSGEAVPQIKDFRDPFNDDIPESPRTWPMLATMFEPVVAEGEMESFSKGDIRVPMIVLYADLDRDKRRALAHGSYVYRAIWQVMNDIGPPNQSIQEENGVQLVQILDPLALWGETEEGVGVLLAVRFTAHMRDTTP